IAGLRVGLRLAQLRNWGSELFPESSQHDAECSSFPRKDNGDRTTAVNVQCGQRTERAAKPLLRRLAGS
ncbi:hypothetical protein ILYODFUR_034353, partial [Ilyodon furcidens]